MWQALLPKFTKTEEESETSIEKWISFLKHAGELDVIPEKLGAALDADERVGQIMKLSKKLFVILRKDAEASSNQQLFQKNHGQRRTSLLSLTMINDVKKTNLATISETQDTLGTNSPKLILG